MSAIVAPLIALVIGMPWNPVPIPEEHHHHEPTRLVWDDLADCESGEWTKTGHVQGSARWDLEAGNGYSGGVQFSLRSWRWVGGSGRPSAASREEQIHRAEKLLALQGWRAWPVCSRRLGLRP